MRRLLLLLAAALLLTACAKQSPPAPAPAPVPPPEESTPAPAPNDSGLKPDPASGLQAVIKQASTSAFQRVAIPAGQPINREGLFFLNVATGAVEGWAIEGYPFFTVSDDNRWVTGQLHEGQYLAERKTGTVYNWSMRDAQLISIRGEVALFMTGTQFWLATGGLTAFQPTGIATAPGAQALIAPDGKAVALLADGLLLLIDTANGRSRQLAQVQAADYSPSGQLTVVAGGFTVWSQPESGRVRTQRYTWDGRLAAEQTTPGTAFFSPDGKLLAWHGSLLGLTDTLTIGTDAVKPLLRLRGEAACSLPYQGPYWLPDGSGIMVSTTRGPRLLKTDGTLQTPKLPEKAQGWGVPVPAPDKPNLYAYDGTMVLDGAGRVLAAAVTHSEGQFYGTGSSRIHPWGETSDEVRFILRNTGKGVSCDPYIFPPEVDKAPFPAMTAVETKVAAGDCVNLRLEYTKESAVVTCVPNGTRLVAAEPPGTSNKGQLGKWGNPAALSMGGEFWWYVRTEKGERGWVYLDSEYLTLAPARPGEPAPDQVQLRLEDELANLRYWYRVSLGELPCTQTTCLTSPTSFGNIEALVNWCASGPAELRKLPGFDPARHGARLAPIEQSCQALVAAPKSLGELAETPAWKAKVKELLTALPPQP